MSTQQDIYAAGSESRPPMLNKENYVPWSSRLLRRMIPKPGDANREVTVTETFHLQTDDALSDNCETSQEIWLRVQQMMKGSDIGIQEKNAKLFNEWERFTSNEEESIESYYHHFLKLMNYLKRNKHFLKKIASNLKQYVGQNVGNPAGYNDVIGNQNQIGNGNLVAARAEGNAAGQNGNQIRCYNWRGVGYYARNCTVRPRRRDAAYLQTQLFIAQKKRQESNSKQKNMI
nr:hypothetical protein [Tanacetum cinerariifolium]